jgi:hypothetical protein
MFQALSLEDQMFSLLFHGCLIFLITITFLYGALYSMSRFFSKAKGGAFLAFLGWFALAIMVLGELFQNPPPELFHQFNKGGNLLSWSMQQYILAYQSTWVQSYLQYCPKNSTTYHLVYFACLLLILWGYLKVTSTFTYKYADYVQQQELLAPSPKSAPPAVNAPVPAKPKAPTSEDPHLAVLKNQQQKQEALKAQLQRQNQTKKP